MIEDTAALIGSGMILLGLWWVHPSLSLVVGGAGLVAVSWRAARRKGG